MTIIANAWIRGFYLREHPRVIANTRWNVSTKPKNIFVWTDGANTFASNAGTGKIEYSGMDSSTVINNALSSMGGGGTLHLKSAIYLIRNTIKMDRDSVRLSSENATLKLADNVNSPLLSISNIKQCSIQDIAFDGNSVAQTGNSCGIHAKSCDSLLIHGVLLKDFRDSAIYAENLAHSAISHSSFIDVDSFGVHINKGERNLVEYCYFYLRQPTPPIKLGRGLHYATTRGNITGSNAGVP